VAAPGAVAAQRRPAQVVDAILSILRTGIVWWALPHDSPPRSTDDMRKRGRAVPTQ